MQIDGIKQTLVIADIRRQVNEAAFVAAQKTSKQHEYSGNQDKQNQPSR
jgi:hypothetical protein